MTKAEHNKYWMAAKRKLFGFDGPGGTFDKSRKLATLVGIPYPKKCHWELILMTEELKHQLTLLAGPHGHAIAKMLEARKELVP